jgi:hypothetical protein
MGLAIHPLTFLTLLVSNGRSDTRASQQFHSCPTRVLLSRCNAGQFSELHISHTLYDPGSRSLPLTITDGDVEGKPLLQIACNTHKYDPGAKGLPLTKTEGDIEGESPQELHIYTRYVI